MRAQGPGRQRRDSERAKPWPRWSPRGCVGPEVARPLAIGCTLIMALSRRQSRVRRLEQLEAVSRPVELPIITDERGMEWRCVGGQNGSVLVAPARRLSVEEWVRMNRVDVDRAGRRLPSV